MSSVGSPLPPQPGAAESLARTGSDRCTFCHQSAGNWYFRVNGAIACTPCAQSAKIAAPADTSSAFRRALLFGIVAALGGMVLLVAFGMMTGLMVGFLALVVGYLVGKAVIKGSKGIGGFRYQLAAALLTYLAVSLSAIPMGLIYNALHKSEYERQAGVQKKPADLAEEQRQLEQEFGSGASHPIPSRKSGGTPDSSRAPATAPNSRQGAPRPRIGGPAALGYLSLFAVASPLLWLQSPFQGILAILILIVGVAVAWQMTGAKRSEILGPFRNTPAR